MVSLVGYVLVSQAVDYEAFTCCEDIICQRWSRMVWVSRMTSRHELWMDDEAVYWDGKRSRFWRGRVVIMSINLCTSKLRWQASNCAETFGNVWKLEETPRWKPKIWVVSVIGACRYDHVMWLGRVLLVYGEGSWPHPPLPKSSTYEYVIL